LDVIRLDRQSRKAIILWQIQAYTWAFTWIYQSPLIKTFVFSPRNDENGRNLSLPYAESQNHIANGEVMGFVLYQRPQLAA